MTSQADLWHWCHPRTQGNEANSARDSTLSVNSHSSLKGGTYHFSLHLGSWSLAQWPTDALFTGCSHPALWILRDSLKDRGTPGVVTVGVVQGQVQWHCTHQLVLRMCNWLHWLPALLFPEPGPLTSFQLWNPSSPFSKFHPRVSFSYLYPTALTGLVRMMPILQRRKPYWDGIYLLDLDL